MGHSVDLTTLQVSVSIIISQFSLLASQEEGGGVNAFAVKKARSYGILKTLVGRGESKLILAILAAVLFT